MTPVLAKLVSWSVVMAAVLLYLAPPPAGLSQETMRAAALLLFTIGFFALGTLPEALTALLFFSVGALSGIAPPNVVFSGFQTGAFWLVFGGLILGEATKKTGLADWLAQRLLRRRPHSYHSFIALLCLLAVALCFVMPSTPARILLLVPLVAAMSTQVGLSVGGVGQRGALLSAILVSYYAGATILTANAPNLVLTGAAEILHQTTVGYTKYLSLLFPVLGAVKVIIIWLVIGFFCREPLNIPSASRVEVPPLSAAQRKLAVILSMTLLLWITDGLHHIHPGWIALAAGAACLMPKIDVAPLSMLNSDMNVGALLYLSAALGLGALITHAGVVDIIAEQIAHFVALARGDDLQTYFKLSLLSTIAGLVTTNPAQPALLVPLAGRFAAEAGWAVEAVVMSFALGFSTLLMPYQSPPVVIGLHIASISVRHAARLTLGLGLITVLVLLPLNYAWWKLLALLPE